MILSDFQQEIIRKTSEYVRQTLAGAEGGHDWWHIYRVWKLANKIGTEEGADLFVIELAALLHDIADPKFHDGDEEIGPELAKEFLEKQGVDEAIIDHVDKIIRNISFKNSFQNAGFQSEELDVVQDADRLDAIGAIGIARAFNYGGFKNRPLYDPGIPPNQVLTKEEYKNSVSPTINHFYEKLLLLKDLMNTPTGKRMAEERHHFMEIYLERFYNEWEGRD
jgi:uncharacterized protein